MPQYQRYHRVIPAPVKKRVVSKGRLVAVVVAIIGFFAFSSHPTPTILADQPKKVPVATSPALKPIDTAAITQLIAADTEDQVGVAVRNISTGKTDVYGVDAPFVAASTTKVLSAVTYYHLVEAGSRSLDTKLGSFAAWFQIKQMIINSSNDSWHAISDEIGNANLQAYASSIGMDFTQGPNTMSPSSMALLLSKLYSGELINKEHTEALLSYMKKTNNETLIPSAVDKGVTTYHKYGDLDDELHDAAILVHGGSKYALVIYTKGPGSIGNRTKLIHAITKTVSASYGL